jgi:microcystin-dependent protein
MFKTITKATVIFAVAAALTFTMIWSKPASASDPFIAQIVMFGGNFAPRGWALCEGQLLPINQYQALFSLLGTTYGGDGRTTFALPDMRGRVAMHPGTGPGLSSYRLGQRGGTETNTLTIQNLPSHNHTATATATVMATNARGNADTPENKTWARKSRDKDYSTQAPDVEMHADTVAVNVTINNTGGNVPVNNIQPYVTVNHIIALIGFYPSRS